jgi:uncharacterized membrane protein
MARKAFKEAITDKRVPSMVAIRQHPLHPIIVVFPIALLMSALGTDLLYGWTEDPFFARGSFWLIGAGTVGAIAAVATGLIEFLALRYVREQISSWSHLLAGVFTLSLAIANFLTRWSDPAGAVLPLGLLLSIDTAIVVAFTGWLGGNLTFRHLIGSYIEEEEAEALAEIDAASRRRETPPK